jgi:hypothetical protein
MSGRRGTDDKEEGHESEEGIVLWLGRKKLIGSPVAGRSGWFLTEFQPKRGSNDRRAIPSPSGAMNGAGGQYFQLDLS